MFSKRIAMAMLSAVLVSTLSVAPTAAKRPLPPVPPGSEVEPGMTSEEQALSDAKVAAAEAYVADIEASGTDLASLQCVTPNATPTADATIQSSCYVPQSYLPVQARDQTKGYYCGPAVGQVIANYSWAVSSTSNKYSQNTIASWMSTDTYGGTGAWWLAEGLNRATANSPRRPANWTWVVTPLQDSDRDGTTADELHAYVRSNVSASKMPLAISVKPHDYYSRYNLRSWPQTVASPGHWITAYGWYDSYRPGSTSARISYTDSSRDEGGATGKFSDPTLWIATMINEHTRQFVW